MIKIQPRTHTAVLPKQCSTDSSGYDLFYDGDGCLIFPGDTEVLRTGISLEFPTSIDCSVRGRSSMASKGILCHPGTIDPDYRGEICVILTNLSREPYPIKYKDRIGQLVFNEKSKVPVVVVSSGLTQTSRGEGGFGSTGV